MKKAQIILALCCLSFTMVACEQTHKSTTKETKEIRDAGNGAGQTTNGTTTNSTTTTETR